MATSLSPFATFAASTAPGAQSASSTSSSSSASGLGGVAPTEDTFLQLLVAQLKYQDPTTPADPTQFVSELAQFSQLEQTMQIRTDTDTLATAVTAPATAPVSSTPASGTTTQNGN
jgi:flagellar basal-body rod modification protein FlgD